MREILSLISYGLVTVFGIFLSASFSGIDFKKNSLSHLILFTVASISIQFLIFNLSGVKLTQQLYPLILHLPLALLLIIFFKKAWSVAVVSVLLAYLCCQIPRWIASITYLFNEDSLYYDILYVLSIVATYVILHRYTRKPIQKIITYSPLSVWGLGLLPLLYYLFDYLTTVYTDILYSGNYYVAQIMPSVMAIGYITFVVIYQSRVEAQDTIQQERQLLSIQLRRSQAEYAALRQMQDQACRFHHDLRHHTTLLMDYADQGALPEIKAYLQEIHQHLDVATFQHFSGHQVVDLLLSHFEYQANEAGVRFVVNAELPSVLPFKDTELCSLLSNGLENAIFAAAQVTEEANRAVTVSMSVRQRNLLLSIQNPYVGDIAFVNGLPATPRPGHGLGTRSIASIVNQHGGLVHFSANNGVFLLRATLPMC